MTLESETILDAKSCWIIAYGNPQCGDDGIGKEVARKLRRHFGQTSDVGICALPQLDLTLLEEVQSADTLVFVDARVNQLRSTVEWSKIQPELNGWAMGSHQLEPKVFVGLLQLLYNKLPSAWMVSVQGQAFGLGDEMSLQASRNAQEAFVQIVDWLFKNNIALPNKTIENEG